MKSDNKPVRNWTFIAYPDSAPDNWIQVLTSYHVQAAVSPLHDSDISDKTGLEKKPHWHVFLAFDGKQSYDSVCEICNAIQATRPERVLQAKGLLRYFVHLDDPNKAQYKVEDIQCLNGFDISKYLSIGGREKKGYLAEIIDFIYDNDICEISDFIVYARREHFDDWFDLLSSSAFHVVNAMITSQRNRRRNEILHYERQLRLNRRELTGDDDSDNIE